MNDDENGYSRGDLPEQLYEAYKPLLFSLAYRMLGSVMDAEDIVHESFLAYGRAAAGWTGGAEAIRHPKAYLCKIVTNRCIDRLKSASKQREVYVGPWLPEPIVPEGESTGELGGDPLNRYLRKESVSTAYLLLLQQLTWVERAVFLLREALQYDYGDIADIVGKSSANCRQIYHRAKRSIGETGKDTKPVGCSDSRASRLVEQFMHALANGDVSKLLDVLAADAVLYSDGGGKVSAAVKPILGADRIVRFLAGVLSKISADVSVRLFESDGGTGLVTYEKGRPQSVLTFHVAGGLIENVYIVVNPDKLRYVT
ncbi:MAG: polymerase sigma factor SigJ [Paenibacillus sp.]|jgi:RNA polymerase sigma-70 factor (ECF subfamily)|nr:polymerase sigma factor SigJ [Paenibacillus sp.]